MTSASQLRMVVGQAGHPLEQLDHRLARPVVGQGPTRTRSRYDRGCLAGAERHQPGHPVPDGVGQDAAQAKRDDGTERRVGSTATRSSTPGGAIRCTTASTSAAGPSSSDIPSQARRSSVASCRSSATPALSDRPRRTMPAAFSANG